jgi:hypothetical protein
MLRIADKTNDNFSQCFGLTETEDLILRHKLLSELMSDDAQKASDVLKKTLDKISNEIDPSFELVAAAGYLLGIYTERANHPDRQMLLFIERNVVESILQG